MADKLQTMKVRATETFWERHPQHPEGEVFLSKGEEGIVAETPEALTAVGRGKLVRLSQESSERKSSSKSTGAGTPIDAEFPGAVLLTGAGYKTTEEVQAASDEELLAIKGLGQATLDNIRAAK
jgi:hypothetical protein